MNVRIGTSSSLALWSLILVIAALGCAEDLGEPVGYASDAEEQYEWHDHGEHDHDDDFVDKVSCGGRWVPPSNVISAGNQQFVSYQGARSCTRRSQPGAVFLGDYIRTHFGHLMNLRVDGRGVQIYNCRSVRSGSARSLHSEGRAIDIFIPMRGGKADNAKGDIIANWLMANAQRIGVQYMIWDRSRYRASGSNRHRCYSGSYHHEDHIHIELSWAAARQETPFFRNPGTPDNPGVVNDNWIGGECEEDDDCGFFANGREGFCLTSNGTGFCTVACAGFCDDRSGKAPTFCAPAAQVGGTSGGLCVSKSDSRNQNCADPSGLQSISVSRYRGNSGARAATATVCGHQGVEGRNPNAWIGDACEDDDDCFFSADGERARCYLEHGDDQGMCTIPCAGYCPDRSGKAPTFCAAASDIGGGSGGICVSRADSSNSQCTNPAGFRRISVDRHRGNSGARAGTALVCAPLPPARADDPNEGGPIAGDPRCTDALWTCDAEGTGRFRCEDGELAASESCSNGCQANGDNAHDTCRAAAGSGELCGNNCRFANDGECDDGGPNAQFSVCELGTDCGDCGAR
ncbi:MAG: hypothetical protein ACE366_14515 [Bradymonadia bacterium]